MKKLEVTDMITKISEAKQTNPHISFKEFLELMVQEAVLPPEVLNPLESFYLSKGGEIAEDNLNRKLEEIKGRGLRIQAKFDRKVHEMDQRTTETIRALKKDYRPLVDDIKDLE